MSSHSCCVSLRHGGPEWQPSRKSRPLLTPVWGRSYAGLTPSATRIFGKGPNRPQHSYKFGKEDGDGLATLYTSQHQTPPDKPLLRIRRVRGKEAGHATPGSTPRGRHQEVGIYLGTACEGSKGQRCLESSCRRLLPEIGAVGLSK